MSAIPANWLLAEVERRLRGTGPACGHRHCEKRISGGLVYLDCSDCGTHWVANRDEAERMARLIEHGHR